MLAVLYLIIAIFFGTQLIRFLIPDIRRLYVGVAADTEIIEKVPTLLFLLSSVDVQRDDSIFCFHDVVNRLTKTMSDVHIVGRHLCHIVLARIEVSMYGICSNGVCVVK